MVLGNRVSGCWSADLWVLSDPITQLSDHMAGASRQGAQSSCRATPRNCKSFGRKTLAGDHHAPLPACQPSAHVQYKCSRRHGATGPQPMYRSAARGVFDRRVKAKCSQAPHILTIPQSQLHGRHPDGGFGVRSLDRRHQLGRTGLDPEDSPCVQRLWHGAAHHPSVSPNRPELG
jgi:hypothetical protein